MVRMEKVTRLGQIKIGDVLLLEDGSGTVTPAIAKIVKVTDYDGEEVIYKVKQNKFFNVGMYLDGKSWVKDAVIVRGGE